MEDSDVKYIVTSNPCCKNEPWPEHCQELLQRGVILDYLDRRITYERSLGIKNVPGTSVWTLFSTRVWLYEEPAKRHPDCGQDDCPCVRRGIDLMAKSMRQR